MVYGLALAGTASSLCPRCMVKDCKYAFQFVNEVCLTKQAIRVIFQPHTLLSIVILKVKRKLSCALATLKVLLSYRAKSPYYESIPGDVS